MNLNRTAGVKEYWIVNPMKETVIVYDFVNDEKIAQYSFEENISVGIFPGLSMNIAELLK